MFDIQHKISYTKQIIGRISVMIYKFKNKNISFLFQILDVEQLGTVDDFIAIPGKGIKCTVTNLQHFFDLSSG